VPRVHLHATSERAPDVVCMEELKKHAAEPEAGNVAQSRKGGMGGGRLRSGRRRGMRGRWRVGSRLGDVGK
jgi:uncharacterized protein